MPLTTVHELEQATALRVRRIQTNGLLEAFDGGTEILVLFAVAHVHLGGVHQHRTSIGVVRRRLGLVQIALGELRRATALAIEFVDGLARLRIAVLNLEQPAVGNERRLVVVELVLQGPSLLAKQLCLEWRVLGGLNGDLQETRDRIPLATAGVSFPRHREQSLELFQPEVSTVRLHTYGEGGPRFL
jgi:hypothetical protein